MLINHFVGHFRLKEARGRAHAEAERAKEAAALALERLADADQQRKRAEQAEKESQADRDRSLDAERQAREQRDRAIAAEQEAVKQRELEAQSRASAMMAFARSQFEQARAIRLSAQLRRRWLALDLLKRAESVRSQEKSSNRSSEAQTLLASTPQPIIPGQAELRTEAVAALLLNDGRVVRQWDGIFHAVSPDGRFAASFSIDLAKGQAGLVINDLNSGQEIATWKGEQAAAVAGSAMALGPGGERLAVVTVDFRSIALWDVRDRKKIRALSMPNPPLPRSFAIIHHMTFSPDGRWLAGVQMREGEATVALWNIGDQGEPQTLAKVKVYPNAMPVFSSDSRRLAVATIGLAPVRSVIQLFSCDGALG